MGARDAFSSLARLSFEVFPFNVFTVKTEEQPDGASEMSLDSGRACTCFDSGVTNQGAGITKAPLSQLPEVPALPLPLTAPPTYSNSGAEAAKVAATSPADHTSTAADCAALSVDLLLIASLLLPATATTAATAAAATSRNRKSNTMAGFGGVNHC